MNLRYVLRSALALAIAVTGLAVVPAHAGAPVPRFLVFTGTYGFRHDGITEESATLRTLAQQGGFAVDVTGDPEVAFSPATYRNYTGVLLLQTTGLGSDASPLTDQQKADFIQYANCGGGVVGIHAAADSGGGWPEYDALLGSYGFDFHPHLSLESRENPLGREAFNPPAVSDVTIQVEDPAHTTTQPWWGFSDFRITDEIYRYKGDPRQDPDLHVVLSLDGESHYWKPTIGAGPSAGGLAPEVDNPVPNPVNANPVTGFPEDSPIAWVKEHGAARGRVFYTNLGHNMATWERDDYRLHVQNGIAWVAQRHADAACLREHFGKQ